MYSRIPLLVVLLLMTGVAAPAHAQTASCQFILGFRALHDLAPADVGECVDNQAFAANGDAQQHTTKGLMAWRKADNWTAFTNGYLTWLNGPSGLVKRLNSQRCDWEGDVASGSYSAADCGPAAAVSQPVTVPSAPPAVAAPTPAGASPGSASFVFTSATPSLVPSGPVALRPVTNSGITVQPRPSCLVTTDPPGYHFNLGAITPHQPNVLIDVDGYSGPGSYPVSPPTANSGAHVVYVYSTTFASYNLGQEGASGTLVLSRAADGRIDGHVDAQISDVTGGTAATPSSTASGQLTGDWSLACTPPYASGG